MSKRRNKGQNKPSTKPLAPAQRQQGQAGPQEGQTPLQEGQATLLQVRTEFSGPLPPADELEKYKRVSPDAAERIIAMAETQSSHRHELEKTFVEQASKGQNYAAMLGALAIICGTIAGILGAQWTGSVIGVSVVGLVSAFIWGRRSNRDANRN